MEISQLYQIYLNHSSIQTDTRKLVSGDLYFALKGPIFNGNEFAEKALEKGAAFVIIDEEKYKINEKCIVVENVLKTLQNLAKHHRQQLKIPIIAITGSNGKTTTKELLTVVLQQKFRTKATIGNLNNHIGVPLTLLKIGLDTEIAIVEMGANHLHEIEGYCEYAQPTHGLITNCGKAHLEGFGGIEGVKKGKGELFDFLKENQGTAFLNEDLHYIKELANGIPKQITYGSASAQYIFKPLMDDVFINCAFLKSGKETLIKTQLVGSYNFANVMAAVTVGCYFDVSIDDIQLAIALYKPDNSRSQWLEKGTNKIIFDAYNANPSSMFEAINNFSQTPLANKQLWMGAMKEMGNEETIEHQNLIELIKNMGGWDQVILVGKEFEKVSGHYLWFETAEFAAKFIQKNIPQNASILIKGSRGSKMELLLEALN